MWRYLRGALLLLVLVASACSSDETGRGVAEGCVINSDCAAPLVCAFRKCHVACATSRDCSPGQRCVASDKPNYVCQLAEERNCSLNSDCPMGKICGVDLQCRDQCAADRDCLGGQVCSSGTCADTIELQDGGLPVVAPEGGAVQSNGQPCLYNSDCPEPLVCRDKVCANACAAESDCPGGSVCIDSRCVSNSVKPIDATGGVASSSSGRVKLTVPPGSLKMPVSIVILPLEAWPSGAIGPAFEILPSGTVFDPPATLTFTYAPEELGAVAPTNLELGQAVGSKWTAIPSTVDAAAHTVTASIAHLSVYAILGPPPEVVVDASVGPDVVGPLTDVSVSPDVGSDGMASGGGSDAATDRSLPDGCSTGSLGHVGSPCSTDCDCLGVAPGLVGICGNHYFASGSINPTPVCMAQAPSGDSPPNIVNCDGTYGVSIGDQTLGNCYPACTIDAAGSHGCIGKDTCMYIGYSTSPTPVAWGFCFGGCTSDQDCTGGDICQVDLGYCRKPARKYVPSKPVGAPCTIAADDGVNCDCGGRAGGAANLGLVCTEVCPVGGNTCPQGFACDAFLPKVDPTTGQPLFSTLGSSGVWGQCAKTCTDDGDCASVNGKCILHAGMAQRTCDANPQLPADAGIPVADASNSSDASGGGFDGGGGPDASFCEAQPCTDNDGCCPSACDANNDNNCMPVCGNGVVEPGETCEGNCACPPSTGCMSPDTGSAATCDLVCGTPETACKGGDACCPYGCDKQSDGDCNGSWRTVSFGTINYASPSCSVVGIYGIVPNAHYVVTTCNNGQQTPGTGDPMITSIVDNLGNQYLGASEDNCTSTSAMPYLAGLSCKNDTGATTMVCAPATTGGIATPNNAMIFRLQVTICATGANGSGAAPFNIFYDAPIIPNPG